MNPDRFNRYTDLTPHQAMHLQDGTFNGPMTAAFLRDGLITQNRSLTEAGRSALEQYNALKAGKIPHSAVIDLPPYTRLPQLKEPYHKLDSHHRKLLVGLARFPGLAYKWTCRVYGKKNLDDLKNLELIYGADLRGAPQLLSERAIQLILAMND